MNAPAPQNQADPPRPGYIFWAVGVLLVCLAWVGACTMRGGEKVVLEGWQDGFATGQSVAQDMDRPMVVYFTASWCGPCQVFKGKVLTDADVQKQLDDTFVAVQVDLSDNSPSNPAMPVAERYGVRSIPTILAMTAEGDVIGKYTDGNEPASFVAWLEQIPR